MKYLLIAFLLLTNTKAFTQEKLFRNAQKEIERFQKLTGDAWGKGDSIKARSYDDSIKYFILGSKIDNYTFKTIEGKTLETGEIKKPIFLLTTASWCAPCQSLVKPLNKIVEEYNDKIQFIVLYWDTKERLDSISKKYSKKISLVPSPQKSSSEGMSGLNISGFAHSLGYPTQYLIKDKRIIDYFTGGATERVMIQNSKGEFEYKSLGTVEEIFNTNYELLKRNIEKLLHSKN